MTKTAFTLMVLLVAVPAGAGAQQRAHRFENAAPAGQAPAAAPFFHFERSGLSIAKWGTLALSGVVGAYGFSANNDAEDRYAALEQACAQDVVRCRDRLSDGRFADADLEQQYQDVVRLDRRARVALIAYTVVALAVIVAVGWRSWRQHQWGDAELPHDAASAGDRHRFLGFATLLLCGLGFVAVVYSALAIGLIGTCR